MTGNYDEVQTNQAVYLVYEYRSHESDILQHVFEDDPKALFSLIEYYQDLAESSSTIVSGEFHVSKPCDKWLMEGDHYLMKRHNVAISHGLDILEA